MILRQKEPRVKDEKYLRWIRTLPCIVTGRTDGVEAAHLRSSCLMLGKEITGKAEKPNDCWTLPLHQYEHSKQHDINEIDYWKNVGIDPFFACVMFNLYRYNDTMIIARYPTIRESQMIFC